MPPPDEYKFAGTKPGPPKVTRRLDLNDDGVDDWWVTAPEFCSPAGDCVYAVYLYYGAYPPAERCGTYVGLTWGYDFALEWVENANQRQFQAISSYVRGETPGFAVVRYGYDGRNYVGMELQLCPESRDGTNCGKPIPLGAIPLPRQGWSQLRQ